MENSETAHTAEARRLAFVITELAPGGAERCLVELATRLDRQRFSPVVYSLAPPPADDRRQLVARLADANVPTHFLGLGRWTDYWRGLKQLAELLREQRAELVQTFLFHANVLGTRAARAAGVPHVVTGIRVADPRGWRIAVEHWTTHSASRHVCVSQSVREFYRRRGFAAEKLVVIPNGIDVTRWRDAPPADLTSFGVPSGRRVIQFAGRFDKQKGLDRFFAELPMIFHALPDHDLLLVGDGPQAATLRRLAGRLRVEGRVHFAAWQSNLPPIMAAADLFVLPSRWEGMPNVVLEAMAAGKPVVATQAEGTVELLGLAALEQTAPLGDWQMLRAQIVEICKNTALATELGQRNQARAEQFSLACVLDRYQRLYDAILRD